VPATLGSGRSAHVEMLRQGLSALRDHADQLVRSLAEPAPTPNQSGDEGGSEDELAHLRVRCTELQRRVHELEIHVDTARREVAFVREEELPQRVQQAIARYRQEERDKRTERSTKRTRAKRKTAQKTRKR
jgi:hypothetical protein